MIKPVQRSVRWFVRRLDTHPISLSIATVCGFALAGTVTWTVLKKRQEDSLALLDSPTSTNHKRKQPMSVEEARLRAMIENAKESTWKENLENAAAAHANFMLPGRDNEMPKFMANVDRKSQEILREDQTRMEKEKLRRDTVTRFWN
eukprot:scaffold22432_cov168-Amphora_coffeaeformis.AAC.11